MNKNDSKLVVPQRVPVNDLNLAPGRWVYHVLTPELGSGKRGVDLQVYRPLGQRSPNGAWETGRRAPVSTRSVCLRAAANRATGRAGAISQFCLASVGRIPRSPTLPRAVPAPAGYRYSAPPTRRASAAGRCSSAWPASGRRQSQSQMAVASRCRRRATGRRVTGPASLPAWSS